VKIERLDFITIFVEDLDKATQFFSDLFGTEFIPPYTTTMDTEETLDARGFNLVSPSTADGPSAKVMLKKGEGLISAGFKVTDLDEAIADFEKRGVRLLYREKIGHAEYAAFHPKDTFGAMLMVVAYPDKDIAAAYTGK